VSFAKLGGVRTSRGAIETTTSFVHVARLESRIGRVETFVNGLEPGRTGGHYQEIKKRRQQAKLFVMFAALSGRIDGREHCEDRMGRTRRTTNRSGI